MKNIAVVTGGYSGEAEISLQSAEQVMNYMDASTYACYKVVLTKEKWFLQLAEKEYPIDKNDFSAVVQDKKIKFDCAFMALHGTPGEDGKLQGYFDMIGLPYTSSGVVTSAITFNKAFTVALLSKHGVNTAKSIVVNKGDGVSAEEVLKTITLPCFVKPNEGGSSIGTTKVINKEDLQPAIERGLKEVGASVIIEEFIEGTEITCAVICYRKKVMALAITEIIAKTDFFDFNAKYKDKATEEITPARITKEMEQACKKTSERIYTILGCKGMIRIDYIIKNNQLFLLEVNSIPGMTERSLLPQQAEYMGISRKELYANAIEEAMNAYIV
jgi:D-alanine-D-alanine ligase